MAALDGSATASNEARPAPVARPPLAKRGTMDWDGVRVFLAIAREGSMRAAGRALRLSQPTIARRLATFEAGFGGQPLFDRLPEGVRLNAAGERLLPAAEDAERAMLVLERRRAAASPSLSGTVRVATGECAGGFVARCLAGSTRAILPSGITVELVDELRGQANLLRRQADMALRHEPPESGDYYVAKLGTFAVAVYRRRSAEAAAWVGYPEEQAHWPTARWVERQIENTAMPVACRASSMLMRVEAIRAGTGRGELPCYVGDSHPLLERLGAPIAELAAEYWMIVHRDLRRAPCVRAAIDWMKAVFAEHRDVLAGAA
ncbi:MAG: LysR family transcriptional regulator [Alphaproteobacteria bacterium]|nr:LysR family transcriptional regulator [Alphaproteobacteria bacterium]